ncbi:MAG: helix-turn-helix domain-containing protein [Candidatus Aenigmarchaeota archaeon]
MAECEVCGRPVSDIKRAEIDGVILEVCDNCVKLGKEMSEPRKVILRKRMVETLEEGGELADDFAEKVRKARNSRNLKQDEVAEKIGLSPSLLRRVENGFRPDEKTAMKIQRFYKINLYEQD